jgi:hypothetical protein
MQSSENRETNGEAKPYLPKPDHTTFTIGGEAISVPPITFWLGETLDAEMSSINPQIKHADYVNVVLKIIATCIEAGKVGADDDPEPAAIAATVNHLKRRLSIAESTRFYDSLTELYRNSGFTIPEAATPLPATTEPRLTQTESSQTSLFDTSATETPSGSNVH